MSMKRFEVCPNCGSSTEYDVCQQCGHIVDSKIIDKANITVTKNVEYNIFLMVLYFIGMVLFIAASITPVAFLIAGKHEIAPAVPTIAGEILTVCPAILFFCLLVMGFIKKALVDKKGTEFIEPDMK